MNKINISCPYLKEVYEDEFILEIIDPFRIDSSVNLDNVCLRGFIENANGVIDGEITKLRVQDSSLIVKYHNGILEFNGEKDKYYDIGYVVKESTIERLNDHLLLRIITKLDLVCISEVTKESNIDIQRGYGNGIKFLNKYRERIKKVFLENTILKDKEFK